MRRGRDNRGDRKLWRLGVSEMVSANPDSPNSARYAARWIFLLTIAKRTPEVLADLSARADEALDNLLTDMEMVPTRSFVRQRLAQLAGAAEV